MKVLLTGAGGRVAKGVRRELSKRHTLRLMDIAPIQDPEDETMIGSITNRRNLKQAVQGMDAVVHLALSSGHWNDALGFDVNVKGTYMLLEEAVAAGVKKAVCTSSLSVYAETSASRRDGVTEEVPPDPGDSTYSLIKIFEEQIVRCFAKERGLSAVILRLTGPMPADEWEKMIAEGGSGQGNTHIDDVAQAFRLALEKENLGFEIFHIGPEDKDGHIPIDKAKQVLGYAPKWSC